MILTVRGGRGYTFSFTVLQDVLNNVNDGGFTSVEFLDNFHYCYKAFAV